MGFREHRDAITHRKHKGMRRILAVLDLAVASVYAPDDPTEVRKGSNITKYLTPVACAVTERSEKRRTRWLYGRWLRLSR